MPALLARYATPLTTGLFVVSLLSGIALFFHFESRLFHGMHEWLSMVLIAPFVLHIWKNWRAFITYFKRPPMAIALGLSLAAGIAMAVPSMTSSGNGERRGPPQMATAMRLLENGSVASVSALAGMDGASLSAALAQKGFTVTGESQTLADIATTSNRTIFDVIGAVSEAGR